MRAITKGPEPPELLAYRAVPGATYDGKDFTPIKDEIRRALLRDQLALCCYCMRRISNALRAHPSRPDAPALVQMKVDYLLVSQAVAQIEHFERDEDGSWRYRRIEAGQVVTLSNGATLAISAVYEGAFDLAAG